MANSYVYYGLNISILAFTLFKHCKPNGPYAVGFVEFHTTSNK